MKTEQLRNIMVGLTVLGALAGIAVMILLFASLPGGFKGGYEVDILIESTGGAKDGDNVHIQGMRVGYISSIRFRDESDPSQGIKMTARVKHGISLPPQAICYVTPNFFGSSWIELKQGDPDDLAQRPQLDADEIYGMIKESGILAEVRPLLHNLTDAAEALVEMVGPAGAGDLPPAEAGLRGAVVRLNRTLDEFHGFAVEARQSVGEITETATNTGEHINALADRMVDSADRLSRLMTTLNRISEKIEAGEGTAGRLVTDDRLYRELVDTAEQMADLMAEVRELVKQWKEDGVRIGLE